jgi:hypothetical protein
VKNDVSIQTEYAIVVQYVVAHVAISAVLDCAGFASENTPWKGKSLVLSRLLGNREEVKE